ncbi:EF-hand calcium-binding domain-containing protein 1 [Dufourea novaeangliae]|uniref:EF-hand calcium-binding domain-containing protein 1 n=1 Tax=Dufourea novaeangliae TaxID=178035 RepID=A0A154PQQ7_DUFNO|nr:EF-hand calcium-binding domain-containing protein 1 [Dufourea novaeangliae]
MQPDARDPDGRLHARERREDLEILTREVRLSRGREDQKEGKDVHVDQWIEGLSVTVRGNMDEKIQFAYKVYDNLKTNKLKREQIFPTMRGCLIQLQNDENPDEAVKDLIDLLLKKLDVDRDGSISEEDFKTAVKERNPLLLECLGPVFPDRHARWVFLNTFTDRLGSY